MKWKSFILAGVFTLATLAYADGPFDLAHRKLQLGDSLAQCRSKLQLRELTTNQTSALLSDYPFSQTHCFLKSLLKERRLVVWTDDKKGQKGWPCYHFGSFSTEGKLDDFIETREGSTKPLLPGTYAKCIESIKKGMSVAKMYELLGTNDAEYFQSEESKWRVRFVYKGYPGQFYIIEADAGTGIIIEAHNGTI